MKSLFYFSRSERRRVVAGAVLLVLLLAGGVVYKKYCRPTEVLSEKVTPELQCFLDSLSVEEKQGIHSAVALHLRRFNPNTCDSLTLLGLGLRPWQAGVFLRYRRAGACFYDVDDLRRVYGLTEEDVVRMAPYAVFPEPPSAQWAARRQQRRLERDSAYQAWREAMPRKLQAGQMVDVNMADTVLLQQVPGIGPYFAERAVRYREQLGGYVSVGQLSEISGFPQEALQWLSAEHPQVRKLRLNKDEFKTLVHHPYLNYEQVKTIFQHRRKWGPLSSLKQLSTEPAFTEQDLLRLESYVSFE